MGLVIPSDVAELLEASSVGIWLATANAECVPQTTRAMGARVDGDVVWLFVPVEQATRALANLREGSQLAVTFCRIFDYRAVQVKGTLAEMRPCNDAERAVLQRYREQFTVASGEVGIPVEPVGRLAIWPSVALAISVRELYSQTPGPSAGAPL